MKKDFVLRTINGYGETNLVKFHAYTLRDAQTIAKNYCTCNMIHQATLITVNGQKFAIK